MLATQLVEAAPHRLPPPALLRPLEADAAPTPRWPSSTLSEWLAAFRDLHERARASGLDGSTAHAYRELREELGRMLLVAQQVGFASGQGQRQGIRVSWALQVDLELGGRAVRAVTVDVSAGGFAALLGDAHPRGTGAGFALRLPGGRRLSGLARVAGTVEATTHHRTSFSVVELAPGDREELERFLFDKILDRLVP
jgi:hypothetical protein